MHTLLLAEKGFELGVSLALSIPELHSCIKSKWISPPGLPLAHEICQSKTVHIIPTSPTYPLLFLCFILKDWHCHPPVPQTQTQKFSLHSPYHHSPPPHTHTPRSSVRHIFFLLHPQPLSSAPCHDSLNACSSLLPSPCSVSSTQLYRWKCQYDHVHWYLQGKVHILSHGCEPLHDLSLLPTPPVLSLAIWGTILYLLRFRKHQPLRKHLLGS